MRAGWARRFACRVADQGPTGGPPYLVERKYDGERALLQIDPDGDFRIANRYNSLYERSQLPRGLAEEIEAACDGPMVLDCEFAFGHGKAGDLYKFLSARARMADGLRLYVFDILELDGRDLRGLPLAERLEIIRRRVKFGENLRMAEGSIARSEAEVGAAFEEAVREGYEGVVVKPLASQYLDGAWWKVKAKRTADVVALGIAKTEAFRAGGLPHSFLIGLRDGDGYRPCGKVGTGLSQGEAAAIAAIIPAIRAGEDSDFVYLKPFLVFEIEYEAFNGRAFRAPRIIRIRTDKAPEDCIA